MTSQHVKNVLFGEKKYAFYLNLIKIIKGGVILITKFNLLDFHMFNKMSPMTFLTGQSRKNILLGFASCKQRTCMIFMPKLKTLVVSYTLCVKIQI